MPSLVLEDMTLIDVILVYADCNVSSPSAGVVISMSSEKCFVSTQEGHNQDKEMVITVTDRPLKATNKGLVAFSIIDGEEAGVSNCPVLVSLDRKKAQQ